MITLTRELVLQKVVTLNQMRLSLEIGHLVSAGFVTDHKSDSELTLSQKNVLINNIQKRLVKINTGLVYKQQKYNLLCEETEGYAKLYNVLYAFPPPAQRVTSVAHDENNSKVVEPEIPKDVGASIAYVTSIIGYFDLDPNRVLDIVLDVMEVSLWNYNYVWLLRKFRKDNLIHILGNRFAMATVSVEVESDDMNAKVTGSGEKAKEEKGFEKCMEKEPAPVSVSLARKQLYELTALLIREKLVDFEPLLPYFGSPTQSGTVEVDSAKVCDAMVCECMAYLEKTTKKLQKDGKSVGQISMSSSNSNSNALGGSGDASKSLSKTPSTNSLTTSTSMENISGASSTGSVSTGVGSVTALAAAASALSASKANKAATVPIPPTILEVGKGVDMEALVSTIGSEDSKTLNGSRSGSGNHLLGLMCAFYTINAWDLVLRLIMPLFTSRKNGLILPFDSNTGLNAISGGLKSRSAVDLCYYTEVNVGLCGFVYRAAEEYMSVLADSSPSLLSRGVSANAENDCEIINSLLRDGGVIGGLRSGSGTDGACLPPYTWKNRSSAWYISSGSDPAVTTVPGSPSGIMDHFPHSEFFNMLLLLGHHIGSHIPLFTRVLKIVEKYVSNFVEKYSENLHVMLKDSVFCKILHYISRVLMPAIVIAGCNPFIDSLVWKILNKLPFHARYECYDSWKSCVKQSELSSSLASLANVYFEECKTLYAAKQQFKRLTKDNVKVIGRQLAKYLHHCPLPVFTFMLAQLECYENLIPFVVEALRYSTELPRDVLSYCLVLSMQRDSKVTPKIKPGETHYEQWYTSLTKFIGTFYRKYPKTELKGMLHFLLTKLSMGDCEDLLVLKELLNKMGGCETTLEISRTQLAAGGLTGGRALKTEIMSAVMPSALSVSTSATAPTTASSVVKREVVNKASITLLRSELISSGVAVPLLLLIAQYRSRIAYQVSNSPVDLRNLENVAKYDPYEEEAGNLKVISHLLDICQDMLMQYTEFLLNVDDSKEDISSHYLFDFSLLDVLPSMYELLYDKKLSIPVAFQLVRPILRSALLHHLKMKNNAKSSEDDDSSSKRNVEVEAKLEKWNPLSAAFINTIVQYHEDKGTSAIWKTISPELYIIFWSCTNSDLQIPTKRYEAEIKKLNAYIRDLEAKLQILTTNASNMRLTSMMAKGAMQSTSNANEEINRNNMKLIRQELKRLNNTVTVIEKEFKTQQLHTQLMMGLIQQYKCKFVKCGPSKIVAEVIVQRCVYDRMLMSPLDATYCSSFFFYLHELNTPEFSTLAFVDELVNTITPLIYCSTDYESSFIGFLLGDVLNTLNSWVYFETAPLFKEKVTSTSTAAIKKMISKAEVADKVHFNKMAAKHRYGMDAAFANKLEIEDCNQVDLKVEPKNENVASNMSVEESEAIPDIANVDPESTNTETETADIQAGIEENVDADVDSMVVDQVVMEESSEKGSDAVAASPGHRPSRRGKRRGQQPTPITYEKMKELYLVSLCTRHMARIYTCLFPLFNKFVLYIS